MLWKGQKKWSIKRWNPHQFFHFLLFFRPFEKWPVKIILNKKKLKFSLQMVKVFEFKDAKKIVNFFSLVNRQYVQFLFSFMGGSNTAALIQQNDRQKLNFSSQIFSVNFSSLKFFKAILLLNIKVIKKIEKDWFHLLAFNSTNHVYSTLYGCVCIFWSLIDETIDHVIVTLANNFFPSIHSLCFYPLTIFPFSPFFHMWVFKVL